MTTATMPIQAVAMINPPQPRNLSSDLQRQVGFVPMANVGEDGTLRSIETRSVGELLAGYTYFADGDVIVAKITPCLQNGKAALVSGLPGGHGFGSTEFHVLRAGPKLDKRYLFYMVWSPDFRRFGEQRFTGSAGQKRMPATAVAEFGIPIPFPDDPRRSLAEQKRIAAILDKADAIRRRRQEAARLADTLIPSVFYEMFGDPVTNPKRWPVVEMEQLFARSPNYGSMQVPTTSPGPDSWLDLRVINIQDGHLDLTDKKYISLDNDTVERHGVLDGDLLLARAIGSPEQLGKCIIARPGQQRWAFDSHLMRVRFDRARALPEFIHAYLTSSGGRHEFLKHTRRSAVQFNINTKEIACVRVTLPPISAQQRFLDVLTQTTHNRAHASNLAAEGDALFHSLVQRAFRGEL